MRCWPWAIVISPVGVISIVKDKEEMQIPRRLVEPCIYTASAGCCKNR